MRQHIGAHLLKKIDSISIMTCGYCGRVGTCNISIKVNVSKTILPVSSCLYYVKFSMASAANVVTSSPCTNRPDTCSICGQVFWTYCFKAHFDSMHPESLCPHIISDNEIALLLK
jgi:hypothetical protein